MSMYAYDFNIVYRQNIVYCSSEISRFIRKSETTIIVGTVGILWRNLGDIDIKSNANLIMLVVRQFA